MDTQGFQNILVDSGGYTTPEPCPRQWSDRLFGWSDLYYYLCLFRIVSQASSIARSGQYDNRAFSNSSYTILNLAERVGARIQIEGVDNLRDAGVSVLVSNHMSMLETVLLPAIILSVGNGICTVVKESLLEYPVFGHVMRAVNPISVTRRNPRDDLKLVLEKGTEVLHNGRSVLIFPQATRSVKLDPNSFNSIGVKLAKRAGTHVVPVALKTDFQGAGKLIKDFGRLDRNKKVHVKFGKSISVENSREAQAQILEFISSNLSLWENQP